jgi:hypothetical protein
MLGPRAAAFPDHLFKSLWRSDVEIRGSVLLLVHDNDQRGFEIPGTTYFRTTASPRQKDAKPPSPRQAAMLLARRPEKLKSEEKQLLAKLNECRPEIPTLYEPTQGFTDLEHPASPATWKPKTLETAICRRTVPS